MHDNNNRGISRRQFLSGAAHSAAALGAASMIPGAGSFFIRSAKASKGKYNFRFGASVVSKTNNEHLQTGIYYFVKELEESTDGEIRVQIIDRAQGCAETNCGSRVVNGIYDIGSSSPQNLGSVFPYSIALDWPMLWGSRDEYINFLFSPESNQLYRDVFARRYGVIPLFGSGEMRSIMMGAKYKDADTIRTPDKLRGAKIRITNSEMIAAFASSMKMNPVPLAFTELLEGLRSGVVDATETWPAAATGFGMQNVISQDIAVDFCPGFEMVFISKRAYEKLPARLQEAMLEASYKAMIHGYNGVKKAQNEIVGNGPDPSPSSVYEKVGLRHVTLSQSERDAFADVAGVSNNEDLYASIRSKLKGIAGRDVLDPLREFQASVAGKPLKPQRWWA